MPSSPVKPKPPTLPPPELVEAFYNRSHRVLGRRLLPLASWHIQGLRAIESPFILGGRAPDEVDLYHAVRICSCGFDTFPRDRRHAGLGRILNRARLYLIFVRWSFTTELEKFREYVNDFHATPEIARQVKRGMADSGAMPDELAVASGLMFYGGWDEKSAWMCPVGKAHHYLAAFCKMDGAAIRWSTARSKEQRAMLRELLRRQKEIDAEELKKNPKRAAQLKRNRELRRAAENAPKTS